MANFKWSRLVVKSYGQQPISALNKLKLFTGSFLVVCGVSLLFLNVYGFSQTLAPAEMTTEHLRFKDQDVTIAKATFYQELDPKENETAEFYAARMTQTIASGLAHLKWVKYEPERFNQRVPIWENFILYGMGKWSGIPEFERYHFVTPEKTIERGIGICGDASMLLSQLLDKQSIKNKIITVPGHVMVEAEFDNNKQLLDPDFGVVFPFNTAYYKLHFRELERLYHEQGFIKNGEDVVVRGIQKKITYWNGVSHFITNKYYFEKFSYWLIWLIPISMVLLGCFSLRQGRKVNAVY